MPINTRKMGGENNFCKTLDKGKDFGYNTCIKDCFDFSVWNYNLF